MTAVVLPASRVVPPVASPAKASPLSTAVLAALIAQFGLVVVAMAMRTARLGGAGATAMWFLGSTAVFAPIAAQQMKMRLPTTTRLFLLCTAGVDLLLMKQLWDPTRFSEFDALLHLGTLNNIVGTGGLFTPNSVLAVSPRYPGLELLTAPLVQILGLSPFLAGMIVLIVCRVVTVVSLFCVARLTTDSPRIAGLAVLVYMCQPHFVGFNGQYAYQSLSLPLALSVLAMVAHMIRFPTRLRSITAVAMLLLSALAVTHHLTSVGVSLALALLTGLCLIFPEHRRVAPSIGFLALFSAFAELTWIGVSGRVITSYLQPILKEATSGFASLITGKAFRTEFFQDGSGLKSSVFDQLLGLGFNLAIPVLVLAGLWLLRGQLRDPLQLFLAIIAASLGPVWIMQLSATAREFGVRALSFGFIGGSVAIARVLLAVVDSRHARSRRRGFAVAGICLLFLGGQVIGQGPSWLRFPGTYVVGGDQRSIDRQTIAGTTWAHENLPAGSVVLADRVTRAVLQSSSNFRLPGSGGGLRVASVFEGAVLSDEARHTLRELKVNYLIVDNRLSRSKPRLSSYFDYPGELPNEQQLRPESLTKFSSVVGSEELYSNGGISVFNVERVSGASPVTSEPGPLRVHPRLAVLAFGVLFAGLFRLGSWSPLTAIDDRFLRGVSILAVGISAVILTGVTGGLSGVPIQWWTWTLFGLAWTLGRLTLDRRSRIRSRFASLSAAVESRTLFTPTTVASVCCAAVAIFGLSVAFRAVAVPVEGGFSNVRVLTGSAGSAGSAGSSSSSSSTMEVVLTSAEQVAGTFSIRVNSGPEQSVVLQPGQSKKFMFHPSSDEVTFVVRRPNGEVLSVSRYVRAAPQPSA